RPRAAPSGGPLLLQATRRPRLLAVPSARLDGDAEGPGPRGVRARRAQRHQVPGAAGLWLLYGAALLAQAVPHSWPRQLCAGEHPDEAAGLALGQKPNPAPAEVFDNPVRRHPGAKLFLPFPSNSDEICAGLGPSEPGMRTAS
ncbi:unnamed protein product, partial [Effrenium voratum]